MLYRSENYAYSFVENNLWAGLIWLTIIVWINKLGQSTKTHFKLALIINIQKVLQSSKDVIKILNVGYQLQITDADILSTFKMLIK